MSIMLRSQFPGFLLENAAPALEYIASEEYAAITTIYDKIFNVKDMKGAIVQSSAISSVGAASAVGEAEQIPLTKVYPGPIKTYVAVKYGLLLASSQELIDDDELSLMGDNAKRMMRGFNTTIEMVAADILNTGFTTNGPDGVPLFSASHPLLGPGGSVGSNLVTAADLSPTSLQAAVQLLRSTVDSSGNKIPIRPKYLIVAPGEEFNAKTILNSAYLPDSGNASVNAVNVLQDFNIQVIVDDYLTDADAWFLAGDKLDHSLNFYWRRRPQVSTMDEFKTEVMLTKVTGRFVAGYDNWRGVVGSTGAG